MIVYYNYVFFGVVISKDFREGFEDLGRVVGIVRFFICGDEKLIYRG